MIYTLGHSVHSLDFFLSLIKDHQLDCILDIRSQPYSKYAPQYSKNDIASFLKEKDVLYAFLGRELGARREEPEVRSPEGKVDFEKVHISPLFLAGIDRLMGFLAQPKKVGLMCAEADPFKCHRFILVARYLELKGYSVSHILKDSCVVSNASLEQKMLKALKCDITQPSLFGGESEANLLSAAYSRHHHS
jgi:uncharacterized protein (DUF488 family)